MTKKTEAKTLESFVARKDRCNAVKIASHCDIPGLVSCLMIEDKKSKVYKCFHTGANLYLDETGFFFDYSKPYGSTQKRIMQQKVFKDLKMPLIARIADGECVTESLESVSPFELIEKLNASDISKFRDLYIKYSNTHGIYSDRMSAEIDAFGELARVLSTEDIVARYTPPYRAYNNYFVNLNLNMECPMAEFIWTIVLPRKSGKTRIEYENFKFIQDMFD